MIKTASGVRLNRTPLIKLAKLAITVYEIYAENGNFIHKPG